MNSIKISDLRPAGSELFQDSESFLTELRGDELADIKGGVLVNQQVSKNNKNIQLSKDIQNKQISKNLTNKEISKTLNKLLSDLL